MTEPLFSELISPDAANSLLTSFMWWFAIVWLGALGGCVGSFLNVVWDRWGTERGIVLPRSQCSECGHPIRWYHNLPVVGWLILGGHCRDCKTKIPFKHPLVEAIFAALFIAIGLATPYL